MNYRQQSSLLCFLVVSGCFNPDDNLPASGTDSSGTTSVSAGSEGSGVTSNGSSASGATAPSSTSGATAPSSTTTVGTTDPSDTAATTTDTDGGSTGPGGDFCGLPAPLVSFGEPDVHTQGESAASVLVADLFGTPGPEIIVGDPAADQIVIWQNNELLGDFSEAAVLPVPPDGWLPAVGDLNGNGRNDLAVSDGEGVWTWISDGEQLGEGQYQPLPGTPGWGVAIADIGGSAFGEVIVQTNPTTGPRLEIFPGLGGGVGPSVFGAPGGRRTPRLIAAHIDSDGVLDLIVPRTDTEREIEPDGLDVFLSRPVGDAFEFEVRSFETGPTPWGVAVGDFNEDGFNDVFIAHQGLVLADGVVDTVQVWLGDGTGNLAPLPEIEVADTLGAPALGDVDCDGNIDAIASGIDGVYMLAGDGNGGLEEPILLFSPGVVGAVAVGQLNADNRLDVVVGLADEGEVLVYYAD